MNADEKKAVQTAKNMVEYFEAIINAKNETIEALESIIKMKDDMIKANKKTVKDVQKEVFEKIDKAIGTVKLGIL